MAYICVLLFCYTKYRFCVYVSSFYFLEVLVYNEYMNTEIQPKISEKKRFSIIARIRSTDNAWRGLVILIKTTHNLWFQIFFAVMVVYMGFILKISGIEWAVIVLATGLVLITEILNTAIEIDINLTSPNYHPYARDTKDIAAGAVLMSAFIAGIVGLIIFLPKIVALL